MHNARLNLNRIQNSTSRCPPQFVSPPKRNNLSYRGHLNDKGNDSAPWGQRCVKKIDWLRVDSGWRVMAGWRKATLFSPKSCLPEIMLPLPVRIQRFFAHWASMLIDVRRHSCVLYPITIFYPSAPFAYQWLFAFLFWVTVQGGLGPWLWSCFYPGSIHQFYTPHCRTFPQQTVAFLYQVISIVHNVSITPALQDTSSINSALALAIPRNWTKFQESKPSTWFHTTTQSKDQKLHMFPFLAYHSFSDHAHGIKHNSLNYSVLWIPRCANS